MNGNVSQHELHELADAAFAPLIDHGFRHYKQPDSAYSLSSNRVAIRATSGDRNGAVVDAGVAFVRLDSIDWP